MYIHRVCLLRPEVSSCCAGVCGVTALKCRGPSQFHAFRAVRPLCSEDRAAVSSACSRDLVEVAAARLPFVLRQSERQGTPREISGILRLLCEFQAPTPNAWIPPLLSRLYEELTLGEAAPSFTNALLEVASCLLQVDAIASIGGGLPPQPRASDLCRSSKELRSALAEAETQLAACWGVVEEGLGARVKGIFEESPGVLVDFLLSVGCLGRRALPFLERAVEEVVAVREKNTLPSRRARSGTGNWRMQGLVRCSAPPE